MTVELTAAGMLLFASMVGLPVCTHAKEEAIEAANQRIIAAGKIPAASAARRWRPRRGFPRWHPTPD